MVATKRRKKPLLQPPLTWNEGLPTGPGLFLIRWLNGNYDALDVHENIDDTLWAKDEDGEFFRLEDYIGVMWHFGPFVRPRSK